MTLETLVPSLPALVVSLAALGYARRADRRARSAHGLAARSDAVSDLVDALHGLSELVRHADRQAVDRADVTAAMEDFGRRHAAHQDLLPDHLTGLGRQVEAAMANYYGPPAAVRLDPDLAKHAPATFDPYWWDVTRTYLDHACGRLQQWRLEPEQRHPAKLIRFHDWRYDEDAQRWGSAPRGG